MHEMLIVLCCDSALTNDILHIYNVIFVSQTELRSQTQGKGEFTMEYFKHIPVPKNVQEELMKSYKEEREAKQDAA